MEIVGKVTVGLIVTAFLCLVAPACGAFFGACGATIVGWWFPTTMHLLAAKTGLTIWQLGAACGFFGGYLARSSTSSSSDS